MKETKISTIILAVLCLLSIGVLLPERAKAQNGNNQRLVFSSGIIKPGANQKLRVTVFNPAPAGNQNRMRAQVSWVFVAAGDIGNDGFHFEQITWINTLSEVTLGGGEGITAEYPNNNCGDGQPPQCPGISMILIIPPLRPNQPPPAVTFSIVDKQTNAIVTTVNLTENAAGLS